MASLSMSKLPQTPLGFSSEPGTPMSGISTVAIKDGHEGVRHHRHHQNQRQQNSSNMFDTGTPTSAERVAQLGGGLYGPPAAMVASQDGTSGIGYFDRVSGWRRELQPGEENGQNPDVDAAVQTPLAVTPGADDSGIEELSDDSSLKASTPFEYPTQQSPSPSASDKAKKKESQSQVTAPIPTNPHISALLKKDPTIMSPSSSTTNASNSPSSGVPPTPLSVPSPASTATTNSVRCAKAYAKMLGPITHDEGIVDTTLVRSPEVDGEPSSVARAIGQLHDMDVNRDTIPEGSEQEKLA